MSTAQAYHQTIEKLKSKYEENEAKSIARILFEDYFGIKNPNSKNNLSAKELSDLENLTTQLLSGVPVQYLAGKANFYGLFFKVTPDVLIPRSETEELVYQILETIPTTYLQKGIDIGTGSGCIPIILKRKRPNWEIHATDVSSAAIEVAAHNAQELRAPVVFHQFDILNQTDWPRLPNFDFIVSNPPYIPPSEKNLMPDSVLNHEPALALFTPEDDPLIFYSTIIDFAKMQLNKGGYLFFEGNEFNAGKLVDLMKKKGFVDVLLVKDMQAKDRIVYGRFD